MMHKKMRYNIIFPKYMAIQLPQHEQQILSMHMRWQHLTNVTNIENQGLVFTTRHGDNLGWTPTSNIVRHANTFHVVSTEIPEESVNPTSEVVESRQLSNLGDEFETREVEEVFEGATVKTILHIRPGMTTTMIEFTPILSPGVPFNTYAKQSLASFKKYIDTKNYVVSPHTSVVFDVENNCIKITLFSVNNKPFNDDDDYEKKLLQEFNQVGNSLN